MKKIQPLDELTERADPELLKQLIHWLANKDPIVRRECLDFLKQKITQEGKCNHRKNSFFKSWFLDANDAR